MELHGTGLRADHRVQVLRGRQAASGIRVTRQQPLGPLVTRVTLLIEEDAPLGDYSIVVVDGEGAHSNALSLEVVL